MKRVVFFLFVLSVISVGNFYRGLESWRHYVIRGPYVKFVRGLRGSMSR